MDGFSPIMNGLCIFFGWVYFNFSVQFDGCVFPVMKYIFLKRKQKEAVELGFRGSSSVSEAACVFHHTALPLGVDRSTRVGVGWGRTRNADLGSQRNSEYSLVLHSGN